MEGYIAPANIRKFRPFPSLRTKFMGVITVQVFPSVQVVGYESYTHPSAYEQWSVAVWTAAAR